ncbi:MAG: PD-(D/E)XK nuclease family protein, partial [Melioribacteraceae bacterium]
IAKKIKELILRENVSPENICVAFNIVGNYSSNIRDIFNKYSIPLNLTDRIQLKSSPPVVAAISLLELIEHDFYYNDIARVLTNGFLNIKNIDLSNLLTVASELKIISGKNNWEYIINDALTLLPYKTELTNYENENEKQKFKKAKADIIYLDKLLSPLREKNTIDEFLKNFKKILLQLKLPCKLLDKSFGKEEEYIKSITVLMQTLTEVLSFIKIEEGEQKYSVNYFIEQIKTIANWARFNVKEKTDQGVLVTSVNEIRGLSFDYLFLGGMCDGDFPTKYQPEIFFSGSFQKKELIHQTEERYHFYQVLSSWSKQLYLTIPKHDADAELVPSTFVKDLEKIVSLTSLENYANNKIFSKEELLIELGKNTSNSKLRKEIKSIKIELEKLLKTNRIGLERTSTPFENNSFSGFIKNDEPNESIDKYLETFLDKEFSSSQFEILAKCPFKYFSEKVLRLKPIAEPKEEAEPIELGNVLHSILYEFYSKVKKEKIPVNNCDSKEFNNLKKIIFEIAEEKINKLNLHSPLAFFEKEKILGIDGVKENSILNKFLLEEQKRDDNFTPFYFEYPFGTFSRDQKDAPNIPPLQIGKLKLRGKIDRIDVDVKNNQFNIVDYKLKGAKPKVSDLIKGISLQLIVYLMAGKHIIENIEEKDFDGFRMFIYSLSYNEKNFGKKPVNLTRKKLTEELILELNDEQIKTTKQHLENYYDKIGKGEFHLSEFEDRENLVCKYCDFKSFCRVQEVFE